MKNYVIKLNEKLYTGSADVAYTFFDRYQKPKFSSKTYCCYSTFEEANNKLNELKNAVLEVKVNLSKFSIPEKSRLKYLKEAKRILNKISKTEITEYIKEYIQN